MCGLSTCTGCQAQACHGRYWTDRSTRRPAGCFDHRMRRPVAAACAVTLGLIVAACGSGKPPHSLFDAAGYHVRDDTVFYLEAFPGEAVEIAGADPASFPPGVAVTNCSATSISFAG